MQTQAQRFTALTRRINEIRELLYEIETQYDSHNVPYYIENQRFYLGWELDVKEKERAELITTLQDATESVKEAV